MKLRLKNAKIKDYTFMGFLIPFLCMIIFIILNQVTPFGNKSLLYSDAYHQYYPFFKEFRRALLNGDSLLYSWNVGMGVDYIGLIACYLASPLNLLSVLVPESWLLEYFTFLTPVRLGLAGLFFAIFLKKITGKKDVSIALFGSLYALCSWALGYSWNVMWLDTFALLPLVALGTYSLLKDRKFALFIITLFLSVLSNYYIGFFICIFVLIIFICYQICRWTTFKRFLDDLLRIGICSVIAIGMTAMLSLPAFAALQTTQSSVNEFPEGYRLNIAELEESTPDQSTWETLKNGAIATFDGMRQVAGHSAGAASINFKEADALPNVSCGTIALILSFLFLTAGEIKLRDKLCSVAILLFLSLSFLIRQLDYIWHGFHFTNMIPYRFSFLYSFVMLYMAYRAYILRKTFKPWQILIACSLALAFILMSNSFQEFLTSVTASGYWSGFMTAITNFDTIQLSTYLEDMFFVIYNFLFVILIGTFLIIGADYSRAPAQEDEQSPRPTLKRQSVASALLTGLLVAELLLTMFNYSLYWSGASIVDYPKGAANSEAVFNLMRKREDDLFYRAETSHTQIFNDAALNGYNGITTFTSSANVSITNYLRSLGYAAKDTYNRYSYETASPVAEMFLNLKYVVDRDGFYYEGPIYRTDTTGQQYTSQKPAYENPYYDVIGQSSLCALTENNAYLPLGFLCDEALADFDFEYTKDRFNFENRLIEAATGEYFDLWSAVDGGLLSVTGDEHVKVTYQNGQGKSQYKASADGIVTYAFTADRDGYLCLNMGMTKRNDFSVWINNNHDTKPDERIYSESYKLGQMIGTCAVKPGDVVEVQVKCKSGESGMLEIYGAILDEAKFRQAHSILAESTMEVTAFENTFVEGKITCAKDGLLYTSIPQNGENWKMYVDGKQVQPVLVGDVMMSTKLTKGTHTITFCYENNAFTVGCIVTGVFTAAFVALWIVFYKPHKSIKQFIDSRKKK